jgi:hypothetical protein
MDEMLMKLNDEIQCEQGTVQPSNTTFNDGNSSNEVIDDDAFLKELVTDLQASKENEKVENINRKTIATKEEEDIGREVDAVLKAINNLPSSTLARETNVLPKLNNSRTKPSQSKAENIVQRATKLKSKSKTNNDEDDDDSEDDSLEADIVSRAMNGTLE